MDIRVTCNFNIYDVSASLVATPHTYSFIQAVSTSSEDGVHKSNTVCDFNTIWSVAAAIIVQLDTQSLLLCTLVNINSWTASKDCLKIPH